MSAEAESVLQKKFTPGFRSSEKEAKDCVEQSER
jgi:hypothetical protein